jgi:hypothetical protein
VILPKIEYLMQQIIAAFAIRDISMTVAVLAQLAILNV